MYGSRRWATSHVINSSNCRTHPRTEPDTAGPAGQGVAVPRGIGQEIYARVGGGGVLELVQPRSQGQDTRECTAQSKCLDTMFVRSAGCLHAVACHWWYTQMVWVV